MTVPIPTQNAIDLFAMMESRECCRSTLIISQPEPDEWYLRIEVDLMAGSILDRIATATLCVILGAEHAKISRIMQEAAKMPAR